MIKRFISANQFKPVDIMSGKRTTSSPKNVVHKDNTVEFVYKLKFMLLASKEHRANSTIYVGKDVHAFLNKHPEYHYNEILGCLKIGKDIKLICDGKTPRNMIRFDDYEIEVKNL